MAACGGRVAVRRRMVPISPVKVPRCRRWSSRRRLRQVSPVLVLGDPDQQQRQPAQQDVGADAVLLAVVDGAQVEGGLHVAPAALDLEQLLVAERDVLGGQGRVASCAAGTCRRGAPRRRRRRGRRAAARRGSAQEPLEAALGCAGRPASSARSAAVSWSLPAIASSSWASELVADGAVALGLVGVAADRRSGRACVPSSTTHLLDLAGCRPPCGSGPGGPARPGPPRMSPRSFSPMM